MDIGLFIDLPVVNSNKHVYVYLYKLEIFPDLKIDAHV